MVPCCAYFSGTRDLCSTACRCVPAIKGVTRPGDSRQCPIGTVVGHRLACLRWCISAILIESNRVLVRRPVRIEGTVSCCTYLSGTRHLCSTACRCVPAIKGVTRPGRRRRQIAICAVIGHGFARRINRTTVGIERNRFGIVRIIVGNTGQFTVVSGCGLIRTHLSVSAEKYKILRLCHIR